MHYLSENSHVADTHNSSGPVGQPMEPEENIQR